jgi:hypothetical protein
LVAGYHFRFNARWLLNRSGGPKAFYQFFGGYLFLLNFPFDRSWLSNDRQWFVGFEEYGADLRRLLKSKHPAVTTAARRALEMIGANDDDEVGEAEPRFDDLVAQLTKLGLRITADQRKIKATTSEAAYFMFADRKEHRPKCQPFTVAEAREWLDGKSVFTDRP